MISFWTKPIQNKSVLCLSMLRIDIRSLNITWSDKRHSQMCCALPLKIYPRSFTGITGQTALISVKQLFSFRFIKLKWTAHWSAYVFPLTIKVVQMISSDAVETICLHCSCTKLDKLNTLHRSVTCVFFLAFETTSKYSVLNFLPEHLFLYPCSLQDTSRKGPLY